MNGPIQRAAFAGAAGCIGGRLAPRLIERLPVMVTTKWVSTPCQPIAVRNVIGCLVGVLAKPATTGGVFDIGGPEILFYLDILRIMREELKVKRRLVIPPTPILTPRLSAYWIYLIAPLGHHIAKPLAEGLKNPVVCREDRIAKLVPQHLLSLREAM